MKTLTVLLAAMAIAGCSSGQKTESATSQSATPPVATPLSVESSPSAAETSPSEPTPSATIPATASAAPNPNLLTLTHGAFVRRWTPGVADYGVNGLTAGGGWTLKTGVRKPVEIVYELPAQAHITGIAMRTYPPSESSFAISEDDQTYQEAGHVTASDSSNSTIVPVDARGRFVRVTVVPPATQGFSVVSIGATGTIDSPAPAQLEGQWVAADDEDGNADRVVNGTLGSVPPAWGLTAKRGEYATFVHDGILTAFSCDSLTNTNVWRGAVDGNGATSADESLHVVAGGTLLIGRANLRSVLAHRVARAPNCSTRESGRGPQVALFTRRSDLVIYAADAKFVSGYRFIRTPLPLLDRQTIGNARTAVIADSCQAGKDLAPWQIAELLRWVSDGHVLVIRDADRCSTVDYSFLPYAFTSSAGGQAAASGKRLAIIASSTLGSGNRSDTAHFIDVAAYLRYELQQLGDTDLMTTHDPHWCGLMYDVNVYNVGGWVLAYAHYGKGLIVYNGFDEDDVYTRIPEAERISQLEYSQSPGGALPCTARVADGPPHAAAPKSAAAPARPATRASIAKALLQSKRARIYGIHFDVASAHIQPQSERVIAEIAQVLHEYPAWNMRVEGHTDSDGGAAYNLALSQRRAESVVADLAKRYHIAAPRLRAAGYGETHPIASNATAAGKALNRRVELVRY